MDNADLAKLIVAPGKLSPKFNPNVTSYSVTVGSNVAEVKLTALTSDSGASYCIKGGDGGKVVKLSEGELVEVTIEVTAEDGRTNKYYTISLKRFSPNDATLSGLDLSAGMLAPPFNPTATRYTCYLPCSIDNISLKPKMEDKNMKATLFGDQPITAINLHHSQTNITLTVTSASGTVTQDYSITAIKQPIVYAIEMLEHSVASWCAVCSNVPHCPYQIKVGGKLHDSVYCQVCLQELTRTNKQDPVSGKPLECDWMQFDEDLVKKLSSEMARCQLPGGVVEAPLSHMGSSVRSNRLAAQKEEPTKACSDCSCKLFTCDSDFHTQLICSAKHSHTTTTGTAKVEVLPWEKRMQFEGDHQYDGLVKQAADWEGQYCKLMSASTSPTLLAENKHKLLEIISSAASCYATATKLHPKDPQSHVSLASILEEMFYLEDLYEIKKDQQEASGDDDDDDEIADAASEDSKDEEFLAICKLRGVAPGANLALQLRAVEQEYHMLKDTGQSAKADHVQALYAWKSKRALQQSQGTYSLNTESSIGKSFKKYSDAVQLGAIHSSSYNMGRTLLLRGDHVTALNHLKTALSFKPLHMETRFCLGVSMAAQQTAPPPHCKKLLEDGLRTFLDCMSNIAETEAEARISYVSSDLLSRSFWQPSNLIIAKGFMLLAKLGGGSWLDAKSCLRLTAKLFPAAGFPHHGRTYQGLLWSLLEARTLQLETTKDKDDAIRLCQQLSGLLVNCGLEKNNELRKLKMKVCHLGVKLEPWSSVALCHLGNTQLEEYDVTEDTSDVKNAELSFRGSISLEGKPSQAAGVPEQLSQQSWYQADKPAITKDTKPTATGKQTTPKAGPTQPSSTTKTTSKSTTASKVVSPTRSKPQPVAAGRGKTTTVSNPKTSRTANNPVTKALANKAPPKPTASAGGAASKGVATLGELKSGSKSNVSSKQPTSPAKQKVPEKETTASKEKEEDKGTASTDSKPTIPAPLNEPSYQPRLGLARVLVKQKSPEEANTLYKEVITMAPHVHDAYIELGEMLAKSDPMAAVDVYCKFPFSAELTFDDAYLYGEIVQLLMKAESYDDSRLLKYMVAMGKVLGLSALEKHVAKLESKFQTKLLRSVYAGVNNRDVNDPELQAFFKFKCWI